MTRRGCQTVLLLVVVLASTAAPAEQPEGPRIVGLRVGFNGRYKVGYWTPVNVEICGGSEGVTGVVTLTLPDGDGTPTLVGRETTPAGICQVPPGAATTVRMYAKFGQSDGTVTAALCEAVEEAGRVVAGKPIVAKTFRSAITGDESHFPSALEDTQELFVTVGPALAGAEDAIHVAHRNRGITRGREGEPGSRPLTDVGQLPTQWYGYEGVDVLVLATSAPETYRKLKPGDPRVKALDEWVRMGGRLLLMVGSQADEVLARNSPLARFAPGRLAEIVTLRNTAVLETYAGSTKPVPAAAGSPQAGLRTPRLTGVRGTIEAAEGDVPLIVRTPYGLGQVIFVAADLERAPFSRWEDRGRLVAKLLDLAPAKAEEQPTGSGARYGYNDLSGQLRMGLDNFTGVRMVPFWVVAGLIVLYILLIGPGDYFFLRGVLRRMQWTWITFPAIVVVVSVGAYVLAYWLKGDQLRINQVDLVDVDVESGRVRGTTWLNFFSPRTDTYDLSFRPLLPDGRPAADARTITSWMGLPGEGLGGMHQRTASPQLWSREYDFSPDLDAVRGVPVQVWSTKGITARWTAASREVYPKGDLADEDGLPRGTITNTLGFPLSGCILAYGMWGYDLGTLEPGQSVRIEPMSRERIELKTLLTRHAAGEETDVPSSRRAGRSYDASSESIPGTLRTMMFFEALGGSRYASGLVNRYQHFVDLSGLLKTNRAILVATGPGRSLDQQDHGAVLLRNGEPMGRSEDRHTMVFRFVYPVQEKMIKTQDLTKVYGELRAINNLTLELQQGDLFGYIGPNGSGKTTTMRILATLLNPTWGEAYVAGYSIYTHAKEIRRLIGYMPDFFGVYDDMKVIEYLEFFAAAYRIKGHARQKICNEVLDLVDLGYKREAFVTSLSRGMTQRLGLARVLLHDPQVLLLDEPASGLDPRARIEIRGLLKELRKMGKTIMVSSHILPELADICNKVGIIEKGNLLICEEVAAVMKRVRQQPLLRIRVRDDLEAAAKLLQQHDIVERVEIRDGHIFATLAAGTEDYSDLSALLVQGGHKLMEFKEDELNLETAFMALTKGITA